MRIAIPLALATISATAAALAASNPPAAAPTHASKIRTCIPLDQIVARRAAGPNAVEFDVIGGITYRNALESACSGIERLGSSAAIAVTNAESGTLCTGDRVKVFDPVEVQGTSLRSHPYCRLGKFIVVGPPAANH
jgi:hypothetical protein